MQTAQLVITIVLLINALHVMMQMLRHRDLQVIVNVTNITTMQTPVMHLLIVNHVLLIVLPDRTLLIQDEILEKIAMRLLRIQELVSETQASMILRLEQHHKRVKLALVIAVLA